MQLRIEAFNVLNHASFNRNPQFNDPMFANGVPVSRTGASLAGPVPYYPGTTAASYAPGSREAKLAQYYNTDFGGLYFGNNGAGRSIQMGLRIFW